MPRLPGHSQAEMVIGHVIDAVMRQHTVAPASATRASHSSAPTGYGWSVCFQPVSVSPSIPNVLQEPVCRHLPPDTDGLGFFIDQPADGGELKPLITDIVIEGDLLIIGPPD
jgi:hypothetical protein